jgi:hypothetical protein
VIAIAVQMPLHRLSRCASLFLLSRKFPDLFSSGENRAVAAMRVQ